MASLPTVSVAEIQVDSVTFPPSAEPPGSTKTLFLGGAGVRGLEIQGKFVAITAIGVYLEEDALPSLAVKWKGKSPEELSESADFFRDLLTGPFEKFTWVRMILPLTGSQYSEKVAAACSASWKSSGTYTDAEATAIEKFLEAFRDETFLPGASVLYTQMPNGSLTIAFTKDKSIPEIGKKVIENKLLSEAILDSVVGEQSISPQAKKSLATRISRLLIHG